MTKNQPLPLPRIVSEPEWRAARDKLLAQEKAQTHALDALAAERRRLPMVKIEKPYIFQGPKGRLRLVDMFAGRRQLILYHFMFAPSVEGWPKAGCSGCSMVLDQMPHLSHLHARNTSFAVVSRAPVAHILRYQQRMGWDVPWFSSGATDFNDDFGLSTERGETFGLSVFLRDGRTVYRTYFTDGRGVETLGTIWTLLDVTPLGRQETWEDSPEGYPQTAPYQWWQRHDEYRKR